MKHCGIGAEEIATKALRAKHTAMRELSTRQPHRIQRQGRAADRAHINANRARDNVDVAQAPPIDASEDLSELASDDSESRSKIEALTGVGNEQEQ
jgi:hypothetical protein